MSGYIQATTRLELPKKALFFGTCPGVSMFGKSITSWFLNFLVAIGILPGGKSKCQDRIGLLVWIIIGTAVSIVLTIGNIGSQGGPDFSVPGLMLFTTANVTTILIFFGTILALSTTWKKYPCLVRDDNLPLPAMPWLFLLVTLTNMGMIYNYIISSIQSSEILGTLTSISLILVFVMGYLLFLVIGVCGSQFQKNMKRKNTLNDCKDANLFGEEIIQQFSSLKSFLSPLLFVVFLVNVMSVISLSYDILVNKIMSLIPELIPALLGILYVCQIMDGCYSEFKSLPQTLRYG